MDNHKCKVSIFKLHQIVTICRVMACFSLRKSQQGASGEIKNQNLFDGLGVFLNSLFLSKTDEEIEFLWLGNEERGDSMKQGDKW